MWNVVVSVISIILSTPVTQYTCYEDTPHLVTYSSIW